MYKSPHFQENVARINRELYEVLRTTTDRATLFERYKESFDVFMTGMTALHSVILLNLDYAKYKDVIERLTSLRNPLNAKEALSIASKLP